jgi:hypothetical protein
MGDCFRYDVNRDTFSRKRNVKMKTLVPETILTKKEDIIMKSLPKKKSEVTANGKFSNFFL